MLLLVLVAACSGRRVYHHVRAGETLYRIGLAYGVPYQEIARANRLRDPTRIRAGQRLLIPKANKAVRVAAVRPKKFAPAPRAGGLPKDAPRLEWPVPRGTVTSGFGPREDGFHDGVDITAPVGAAVRAAADGEVAYSSTLRGYGNVIILRHRAGYVTLYAHNERHHAKQGQRVRQGQLIATVGRSGRTTGPNLHFEVRKNNVAQDPLHYLPARPLAER